MIQSEKSYTLYQFVTGMIFQGVESILVIGILCVFVSQSLQHKKMVEVGKYFSIIRNSAVMCMISFAVNGLFDTVIIALVYFNETIPISIVEKVRIGVSVSNLFGVTALIIFQSFQVYDTFKNTAYSLSKYTICFLFLVIVTDIGCMLGVIIGRHWLYNDKLELICLFSCVCCTVSILIMITFLFAYKLFHLMMVMRDSMTMTMSMSECSFNVNSIDYTNSKSSMMPKVYLSTRQVSLLQTITKRTLLTFVISLFYLVFLVDQWVVNRNIGGTELWTFALLNIAFTELIAPLCIWLSFGFATKQYFRVCSKFHHCFYSCYKSLAMKQMKRENENELRRYHIMKQELDQQTTTP